MDHCQICEDRDWLIERGRGEMQRGPVTHHVRITCNLSTVAVSELTFDTSFSCVLETLDNQSAWTLDSRSRKLLLHWAGALSCCPRGDNPNGLRWIPFLTLTYHFNWSRSNYKIDIVLISCWIRMWDSLLLNWNSKVYHWRQWHSLLIVRITIVRPHGRVWITRTSWHGKAFFIHGISC